MSMAHDTEHPMTTFELEGTVSCGDLYIQPRRLNLPIPETESERRIWIIFLELSEVITAEIKRDRTHEIESVLYAAIDRLNPSLPAALRSCTDRPVVMENRQARVLGHLTPALSESQFKVVTALLEAGPAGVSKNDLENITGDARKVLSRLKTKPHWEKVIHLAGTKGGGYRIDWPTSDPHDPPTNPHRRLG